MKAAGDMHLFKESEAFIVICFTVLFYTKTYLVYNNP